MTREKKEQLSNRLVLNFGILLAAGLVLLYVNTALRNGGSARSLAYLIVLITGIVSAVGTVFLFVWGKLKKPAVKNYSAVFLGMLIGCVAIYVSKFPWFIGWGYNNVKAVICVYLAMAFYFIVLAIITGIQMRKPLIKDETKKIVHAKKRK